MVAGAVEAVWATQQTPGPAPTEDRVGFPDGYETAFTLLNVGDRPTGAQPTVRRFFVNDVAASVVPGEPWPYGSVLIMETNAAARD